MELIDTHCHIQSAAVGKGEPATRELWAKLPGVSRDKLISNAVENKVTKLVCVGCDPEDSRLAVDFARSRPACWATIGIHPHEAQHFAGNPEKLSEFADLVQQPKVVAVGECGFDFYYNHSPKTDQIKVLQFQIELALEHNLTLVFHVREAFDDFWPVFASYQGIRGVLHSFTDSMANLEKALARNLYIGVNGIATFAKNDALSEVYRSIPIQNLLLETDAPFLTPTPYRGSINEPKHIGTIAEYLANLRGENLLDLAAATTHNAQTLFGI